MVQTLIYLHRFLIWSQSLQDTTCPQLQPPHAGLSALPVQQVQQALVKLAQQEQQVPEQQVLLV
jgi:hypothetical protein